MRDTGATGMIEAVGERLSAGIEHGASTLRLALAESRLAATGTVVLAGIALALLLLFVFVWLLLVVLAGYGLWVLGLGPALALALLLVGHLLAALVLGLLARRLTRDLTFTYTRQALASLFAVAVPDAAVPDAAMSDVAARDGAESGPLPAGRGGGRGGERDEASESP